MRLKADDLKRAAQVCFRSASELLEDALALESLHRYARAAFLAFVGMEELGKARFALELLNLRIEPDMTEFQRFWRHHPSKIAYAKGFFPYDPAQLQRNCPNILPPKYRDWFHYDAEKRKFYDEYARLACDLKMGAIYVDYRHDRDESLRFTLPSQSIKKEHARRFVKELEDDVRSLEPKVTKLGPFYVPAYDTGYDEMGYDA